jgi:hypothetical protein
VERSSISTPRHNVNPSAADKRGSRRAKVRGCGAGLIEQFRSLRSDVTRRAFRYETSTETALGEEFEPKNAARHQESGDQDQRDVAPGDAEVAIGDHNAGDQADQTGDARHQSRKNGFEGEEQQSGQNEHSDQSHAAR